MSYFYILNENLSDPQASTVTITESHREPTAYNRTSLEIAIANTEIEIYSMDTDYFYQLAKYQGALAFLLRAI